MTTKIFHLIRGTKRPKKLITSISLSIFLSQTKIRWRLRRMISMFTWFTWPILVRLSRYLNTVYSMLYFYFPNIR